MLFGGQDLGAEFHRLSPRRRLSKKRLDGTFSDSRSLKAETSADSQSKESSGKGKADWAAILHRPSK